MRRTILILTATALMVVLMATTVSPAFADHKKGPCWAGHWGWGVQPHSYEEGYCN